MANLIKFLSSFFSVSTLIGLIAAIIAGIIFIIYTQNKIYRVQKLAKSIDTDTKAGIAKAVIEVVDLEVLLKETSESTRASVVKIILKNKQKKFDSQISIVKFGIIIIGIILLLLIISNFVEKNKLFVNDSPDVISFNKLGMNAAFILPDSASGISLSQAEIEKIIDGRIRIDKRNGEKQLVIQFTFSDSLLNKRGFKFHFSDTFYDCLGGTKRHVPGWSSKVINDSNREYFVMKGRGFDRNLSFTTTYICDEQ